MPENPGIKQAHNNACSKSSRLSNCDTMIFFPSQLRVSDTCNRPFTRSCASGGKNFCKPSSKHVWMLKDGENGPSECDRASFTTRKKSDVISPAIQNEKYVIHCHFLSFIVIFFSKISGYVQQKQKWMKRIKIWNMAPLIKQLCVKIM